MQCICMEITICIICGLQTHRPVCIHNIPIKFTSSDNRNHYSSISTSMVRTSSPLELQFMSYRNYPVSLAKFITEAMFVARVTIHTNTIEYVPEDGSDKLKLLSSSVNQIGIHPGTQPCLPPFMHAPIEVMKQHTTCKDMAILIILIERHPK